MTCQNLEVTAVAFDKNLFLFIYIVSDDCKTIWSFQININNTITHCYNCAKTELSKVKFNMLILAKKFKEIQRPIQKGDKIE